MLAFPARLAFVPAHLPDLDAAALAQGRRELFAFVDANLRADAGLVVRLVLLVWL